VFGEVLVENSETEKLECLKHISIVHRKILATRILQEWKVTLLTLGFYGSIILSKIQLNESLISSSFTVTVALIPAFVAICFLYYLHQANIKNSFISKNAEKSMQQFVETGQFAFIAPSEDTIPSQLTRRSWLALFWQSLIIILFSALSLIIVK
jgi:hypothetical protein